MCEKRNMRLNTPGNAKFAKICFFMNSKIMNWNISHPNIFINRSFVNDIVSQTPMSSINFLILQIAQRAFHFIIIRTSYNFFDRKFVFFRLKIMIIYLILCKSVKLTKPHWFTGINSRMKNERDIKRYLWNILIMVLHYHEWSVWKLVDVILNSSSMKKIHI